eukprot:CAMPEP_0185857464 /NCGR_PEP_ID=MMETSP1354-20130828/29517_1 /TAXON_ID=708628 /ORGANISM="Erythrolobus madagascarensis, Strain CCMP3276" /LENGTH=1216 /DNA_ID=CAMNT_0028559735 /DNA_START=136 /DNA_END=3786 /DNA_ORIENTATION=-
MASWNSNGNGVSSSREHSMMLIAYARAGPFHGAQTRFGDEPVHSELGDWTRWCLRMWDSAHGNHEQKNDKMSNGHGYCPHVNKGPPYVVRPLLLQEDGSVLYDTSAAEFHEHAEICVQPVCYDSDMSARVKGKAYTNGFGSELYARSNGVHHHMYNKTNGVANGGSNGVVSKHVNVAEVTLVMSGKEGAGVVASDHVKIWRGRRSGAHMAYAMQGCGDVIEPHVIGKDRMDDAVFSAREKMGTRRFVEVAYLRCDLAVAQYRYWDLWTWDKEDLNGKGVGLSWGSSVELEGNGSGSLTAVVFRIDRAMFGRGDSIQMLARNGGDAWHLKGANTVGWRSGGGDRHGRWLLLEGHDKLVRNVYDAFGSMKITVSSVNTVLVKTTLPCKWFSKQHERHSAKFHTVRSKWTGQDGGAPLDVAWVNELDPWRLELRCVDGTVFDEDFPVEKYALSIPNMHDAVLSWPEFDHVDAYYYDGKLGWEYSRHSTTFRVFAPSASVMNVVIYNSADGDWGRHQYRMRRIMQGVWKIVIQKDLAGKYYKLLAEGDDKRLYPGVEVIDPYSRCNTAHNGRGLIYGHENTHVSDRPHVRPEHAIVYELHVRDATIDGAGGVADDGRGKYVGLTQRGTRYDPFHHDGHVAGQLGGSRMMWNGESGSGPTDITTALDHIVEMGVTHVQIMPVQDFDNEEWCHGGDRYWWGYMPVHFNSPDGWYASATHTAARVSELKRLISALHDVGVRVIMDVVYNHTAEDSNEYNLDARFSFNGVEPRYYYRTCGNTPVSINNDNTCAFRGMNEPRCGACYSNGSGCGNEFRSEAPMGRKFLLDSLLFWVNEYKVDGFRFDLLGLIDTPTVEYLTYKIKEVDPNIMIYGEPWTGGPTPIAITDKGTQRGKGFSLFNNTLRDALRGSPFGVEENFLMDGGCIDHIKRGILGSIDEFTDTPFETINYIECHDNRTLYDQFREYVHHRSDDIVYSESDFERMSRLGALVVLTSQGVPFIQMGQEMLRTKGGVENSYCSPDSVNMVRWGWKAARMPLVRYYRGLIALRRAHPKLFGMTDPGLIRYRVSFYEHLSLPTPHRCIAYTILGYDSHSYRYEPSSAGFGLETGLRQSPHNCGGGHYLETEHAWREVVVLLNPTPTGQDFALPGANEDRVWVPVVSEWRASTGEPVGAPVTCFVNVPGRSGMILRTATLQDAADWKRDALIASWSDPFSSPFCTHDNGF